MLLAAVIACLGSFSVATAADYAVNSADEFLLRPGTRLPLPMKLQPSRLPYLPAPIILR